MAEARFREIVDATAAYGCTADILYQRGCPVTISHEQNAESAAEVVRAVAGDSKVRYGSPPLMGPVQRVRGAGNRITSVCLLDENGGIK